MFWSSSSSFPHRPGLGTSSPHRLGGIVESSISGNNDRIVIRYVHGTCVVRRNEGRE
jgi:hypothetical protein